MQYRYRGLWSPHIKVFVALLREKDNPDLLVEVFGCLANMTAADLPSKMTWTVFLKEYKLLGMITFFIYILFCIHVYIYSQILGMISKNLIPGMAQNDMILEIVLLIIAMASSGEVCV